MPMKLLILIFQLSSICTLLAKEKIGSPPTKTSIQVYDPKTEKCCRGSVFPLKTGQKCCGESIYDPQIQLCCGGKIIFLDDVERNVTKCCRGITIYDNRKELCCGGYDISQPISPKKTANDTKCCGNDAYDPNGEVCCVDFIVQKQHFKHWVLQKDGTGNTACCGDKLYDESKFDCCGSNLFAWDGKKHIRCCGEMAEDSEETICCTNKNGSKYTMKKPDGSDGCCGQKPYNKTSEICCGDLLYEITSKNMKCCGQAPMDKNTQVCWFMRKDTFKIFNLTDVHPSVSGYDGQVCGDKIYSNTGICCTDNGQSKFYNGTDKKNKRCCGLDLYNKTEDICCGNEIHTMVSPTQYGCCESKLYKLEENICCQKNLLPKESKSAVCCGNGTYDKNSQKCCSDFLVIPNNKKCCNFTITDRQEKLW